MKYVCKQISPEYQESPMMICNDMEDDVIYSGLFLIPESGYYGIREKSLSDIKAGMNDIISEYEDFRDYGESSYYKNFSQVVNNILPREDKKNYSTHQIHEWKEIAEIFEEDSEDYAKILSLITGNIWETSSIHGYCQGDYAEVIYNTSQWSKKAIKCIESEYFNMGSEWECDCTGIADDAIITEDSITDSVCVYAYSWDDEEVKQELADAICCDTKDVIMYKYAGSHTVADYERL